MTKATTTIKSPYGMHARPSSAFVQLSSSFNSKVQLKAKGKIVDAKSILMIMSMGLVKGTEVTIVADGLDEEKAVRQLIEVLESRDTWEFVDKATEFWKQIKAHCAERLKRLEEYTTTKKFLANVDRVAFDQDELTDLIGKGTREIYLCANSFEIPLDKKDKIYIGIGKAVAVICSEKPVDFDALNINFKNISFDDDYKKLCRKKVSRAKKSVKATQTNTTPEVKPMARKERFALIMEDGLEVRNIDDLKAHFDVGTVVREFKDGRLLTWLEDRYYDEEAAAIKKISPGDDYLAQRLCEIFGVETPEDVARREERLNRLKQYTSDKNILANVDRVAFDQEDLADLLDEGAEEIYLCENRFVIPLRMKNKNYIGIGNAVAVIGNKKQKDFAALNIKFKNISFDNDKKASKTTSTLEEKNASLSQSKVKSTDDTARATTTININRVDGDAAVAFVMKAKNFKSKVWLNRAKHRNGGGNNIVSIVTMSLTKGDKVTITATGEDAKQAVAELKNLIDSGFPGATLKDVENFFIATTTIEHKLGMHPHPASTFVQIASKFKSKIQLCAKDRKAKDRKVDAKSILMIMSMGLVKGTEVTIVAEGSDAKEAVGTLIKFIDDKFGYDY